MESKNRSASSVQKTKSCAVEQHKKGFIEALKHFLVLECHTDYDDYDDDG